MVVDYLKKGRENAIPSKVLAEACGYSSTRELQAEIARERAAGEVILSTTSNGGGYFLPAQKMKSGSLLQHCPIGQVILSPL